ncbi:MAG: glucose-6-phosphate isomerase, partial [Candidatus Electrothrix sp. EH2]|nr:glucose-6-phosphate isomerase [Candidatus Electrothrix sp. EH2]
MDFCKNFIELKAVHKLQELSRSPYTLSAPNALSPDRLAAYRASCCGFDFLYGTQRVDEQVMRTLQELADEAGLIEQFKATKSGVVMNRIMGHESEERQVLHTACRDIFTENPLAPEASAEAEEQLARLQKFLDDLDNGIITNQQGQPFTTMVQVGIGGSDLGPRALYLALKRYCRQGRRASFIANVDPDDAADVLAE